MTLSQTLKAILVGFCFWSRNSLAVSCNPSSDYGIKFC